ncbi:hypothetical protein PANI_CDS0114 [Maribacter phage Panino]
MHKDKEIEEKFGVLYLKNRSWLLTVLVYAGFTLAGKPFHDPSRGRTVAKLQVFYEKTKTSIIWYCNKCSLLL